MVDANEMVDERRGVEAELAANETLIFVVPLALDENPRLTVNISSSLDEHVALRPNSHSRPCAIIVYKLITQNDI